MCDTFPVRFGRLYLYYRPPAVKEKTKRALVFFGTLAALPLAAQETPRDQALRFMREETQFQLGFLPTEQSHPRTRGLSQTLQTNTVAGLRMLVSVDDDIPPAAWRAVVSPEFAALRGAIAGALDRGRSVYFSGCGATGRLAILLDAANRRFWREAYARHPELKVACGDLASRTRAVMTGGDFALIRSVESFEDYFAFGYRQMEEAGVRVGDVVVAISEGGETSSVLGTVQRGVDARAEVFFLFNNPPELLARNLDRCRHAIENDAVVKLPLCTGPMAVAGSTRMQAATIELLVAGAAFEAGLADHLAAKLTKTQRVMLGIGLWTPPRTVAQFETLLDQLRGDNNAAALARMADDEAEIYAKGGRVTYFADAGMLDIFTDTTERSPTFKIPPFRSVEEPDAPAPWAFVKDPLRPTPEAWTRLLEREPRGLEWDAATYARLRAPPEMIRNPPRIGRSAIERYRIGKEPDPSRTEARPNLAMAVLVGREAALLDEGTDAAWRQAFLEAAAGFDRRAALVVGRQAPDGWRDGLVRVEVDLPETPLRLFDHLALKLALNNVSTATMGKLGRLNGNWMAHVDASNKKLIDRSVRLVSELAGVDYTRACVALFESLEEIKGWDEARRRSTSPAAYTAERLLRQSRDAGYDEVLDLAIHSESLAGAIGRGAPYAFLAAEIYRATSRRVSFYLNGRQVTNVVVTPPRSAGEPAADGLAGGGERPAHLLARLGGRMTTVRRTLDLLAERTGTVWMRTGDDIVFRSK